MVWLSWWTLERNTISQCDGLLWWASSLNFTDFLFLVGISSRSKPGIPPHNIQAKLLGLWTSSLWRVRFLERHSWKMPMFKILGTNPGPCAKRANCWGYVFHPKTMGAPSPDLLPKGWMLFDGQVRWKSLIDFLVCYYTRPSPAGCDLKMYSIQS